MSNYEDLSWHTSSLIHLHDLPFRLCGFNTRLRWTRSLNRWSSYLSASCVPLALLCWSGLNSEVQILDGKYDRSSVEAELLEEAESAAWTSDSKNDGPLCGTIGCEGFIHLRFCAIVTMSVLDEPPSSSQISFRAPSTPPASAPPAGEASNHTTHSNTATPGGTQHCQRLYCAQ